MCSLIPTTSALRTTTILPSIVVVWLVAGLVITSVDVSPHVQNSILSAESTCLFQPPPFCEPPPFCHPLLLPLD